MDLKAKGRQLFSTAKYAEAIQVYHQMARTWPSEAHIAHNNIGLCYTKLADKQRAQEEFLESVRLNQNYSKPKFKLAEIYIEKKDWYRAYIFAQAYCSSQDAEQTQIKKLPVDELITKINKNDLQPKLTESTNSILEKLRQYYVKYDSRNSQGELHRNRLHCSTSLSCLQLDKSCFHSIGCALPQQDQPSNDCFNMELIPNSLRVLLDDEKTVNTGINRIRYYALVHMNMNAQQIEQLNALLLGKLQRFDSQALEYLQEQQTVYSQSQASNSQKIRQNLEMSQPKKYESENQSSNLQGINKKSPQTNPLISKLPETQKSKIAQSSTEQNLKLSSKISKGEPRDKLNKQPQEYTNESIDRKLKNAAKDQFDVFLETINEILANETAPFLALAQLATSMPKVKILFAGQSKANRQRLINLMEQKRVTKEVIELYEAPMKNVAMPQ